MSFVQYPSLLPGAGLWGLSGGWGGGGAKIRPALPTPPPTPTALELPPSAGKSGSQIHFEVFPAPGLAVPLLGFYLYFCVC